MNEVPIRKTPRLKEFDYSTSGYYFITICTKDRKEILSRIVGATVLGRPYVKLTETGKLVETAILHNNRNEIKIDRYIIMPNHIHMIISISPDAGDRGQSPLQMIIRNMKAYITKQIGFSVWQRSFHDHIIRDENDYLEICKYIDDNPFKWTEDKYYT